MLHALATESDVRSDRVVKLLRIVQKKSTAFFEVRENECRVLQEKAKKQKVQAGKVKKAKLMALKQQTETSQQRQKRLQDM
jgi:hypothetical protein